jgi:hypothetical protein
MALGRTGAEACAVYRGAGCRERYVRAVREETRVRLSPARAPR